MGIQVVQHQVNATCLGTGIGQQIADERNEVDLAALRRDFDDSLTRPGLNRNEQVGGSVAYVLVVLLGRAAFSHRQWLAAVGDEMQTLLVDADLPFRYSLDAAV